MVSKTALRRRRKQGNHTSATQSATPPSDESSYPQPSRLSKLAPYVVPPLKVLSGIAFGGLCAASLQSNAFGLALFVITVLTILAFLFKVFYSMLDANDQTLIPLPTVYKADGTVIRQSPLTVLEHDRRFAQYYSAELPLLALAAAWFHLWTAIPGAFMVLALYASYRLLNHPIFRVHVFNDNGPGTERPFGIAPLFSTSDASRVKIVGGLRDFRAILAAASNDTLVIVDASATWCAPCQAMAPVFRKLADEFPKCEFLTVDVDVSQDVAAELGITSVPSFLFFQAGQRLELLRGGTEEKLRATIASYLS